MTTVNHTNQVGLIGAGVMGCALIVRLVANGFDVSVYDPSSDARTQASKEGGRCLSSAEAVFAANSLVITCVASTEALKKTIECAHAARSNNPQASAIIEVSTLSLAVKESARQRVAEVGVAMVDCTLSGTAAQARNGDLVIFASGQPDAIALCYPIITAIGQKIIDVGSFGQGTQLKLLANHLVCVHVAAAAEALSLAKKSGLDVGRVLNALTASAATSRMLEVRGPLMVKQKYTPATGSVDIIVKDGKLIKEMAAHVGLQTPLFDLAHDLFSMIQADGLGSVDTAYLHDFLINKLTDLT